MAKDFEPHFKDLMAPSFNAWEAQEVIPDLPKISEEETMALLCEQAKEEARHAGYAEGLRQAEISILHQQKELKEFMQALLNPMQLVDEALIKEMVFTLVWLCKTCIGIELSIAPDKLEALIKTIKDELPSLGSNKIIKMHPEDLAWVKNQEHLESFQQHCVEDASLSRGDFLLESDASALDGQLITRLATIFAEYVQKEDLIPSEKSGSENV